MGFVIEIMGALCDCNAPVFHLFAKTFASNLCRMILPTAHCGSIFSSAHATRIRLGKIATSRRAFKAAMISFTARCSLTIKGLCVALPPLSWRNLAVST